MVVQIVVGTKEMKERAFGTRKRYNAITRPFGEFATAKLEVFCSVPHSVQRVSSFPIML